jgi:threonine dehydrogenase-like Zn-dependent dehydrogenase
MQTEVSRYWGELIPMMQSGRIRPERFITTTAALRDGLDTYERCVERSSDVLKVMMKP